MARVRGTAECVYGSSLYGRCSLLKPHTPKPSRIRYYQYRILHIDISYDHKRLEKPWLCFLAAVTEIFRCQYHT